MTARRARGAATQRMVALYLAGHGWPYATDAGAGRAGSDILGVPGLAIEVKARRDFSPLAWIRQAATGNGLPMVVHRPDGMGPATIAEWPVTLRLADLVDLLRRAGYGDPLPDEPIAEPALSPALNGAHHGQPDHHHPQQTEGASK